MRTTPCITLYQPWASWIAMGWKSIETRTHQRFGSLLDKRIGIHAGMRWDPAALATATPFLTLEQQMRSNELHGVKGRIVATARVVEHKRCEVVDEPRALIECATRRYGLVLDDVRMLNIPAKGDRGIWYFDIDDRIEGVQQCRVCGCTEELACTHFSAPDGEPCYWAEPDLCSACMDAGARVRSPKLPAALRDFQGGVEVGTLAVFTHNLVTATEVANRVEYSGRHRRRIYPDAGCCFIRGKRVWWCKRHLADRAEMYEELQHA